MNLQDWLKRTTAQLAKSDVGNARLDALIMLEDVLLQDRSQLLAEQQQVISIAQLRRLQILVERRGQHEPLAYIRGYSQFYGREFTVNPSVLVPRPESETIIELLKQLAPEATAIIDVGTGSGALAISAKLELPTASVYGLDINDNCLVLARQNAQNLAAEVTFLQGDLLEPVLAKKISDQAVLLCNLPYVPDALPINKAATHEPRLALFGGPDGLDLYRQLFDQLAGLSAKPRLILAESLPMQHSPLLLIAAAGGYHLLQTQDFIQAFGL